MMDGSMMPKEKVIKAIHNEETEEGPVDFGGGVQSTIHAYAYAELKKFPGIESGSIERLTDRCISNFDILHEAVGDAADIVMLHKDMGCQGDPIRSPDHEIGRETRK